MTHAKGLARDIRCMTEEKSTTKSREVLTNRPCSEKGEGDCPALVEHFIISPRGNVGGSCFEEDGARTEPWSPSF